MKLPGYFTAYNNRFIGTRDPLQIHVNSSVVTSNEENDIRQWCKANNCKHYLIGMIEFPDEKTKTLFLMRWL